jgi:hypothetical protein
MGAVICGEAMTRRISWLGAALARLPQANEARGKIAHARTNMRTASPFR